MVEREPAPTRGTPSEAPKYRLPPWIAPIATQFTNKPAWILLAVSLMGGGTIYLYNTFSTGKNKPQTHSHNRDSSKSQPANSADAPRQSPSSQPSTRQQQVQPLDDRTIFDGYKLKRRPFPFSNQPSKSTQKSYETTPGTTNAK